MKLESYIKENRKALDVEKPDENRLWRRIKKATGLSEKSRLRRVSGSVAAIAAIAVLSVITVYFIGRNQRHDPIFMNVDPELAKKEVFFLNQIENYSDLIKNTRANVNQLVSGENEIEYIDDLINHYSEDLKNNGPNPKLINSLMDLYEKKILILNRMLNEIEKNESHEKRKINM